MKIARRTSRVAALALVVLAACGGADPTVEPPPPPDTTQPDTTQPDTTQPDTTQPDTTQPEVTMPDDHPAVVAAAIADLAERTGRNRSEIEVVHFESVTWSDGSIGCPEPGVSYTQAIVPGYRIELSIDGTSYWYHGARDGDPFWCDAPAEPIAGEAGDR